MGDEKKDEKKSNFLWKCCFRRFSFLDPHTKHNAFVFIVLVNAVVPAFFLVLEVLFGCKRPRVLNGEVDILVDWDSGIVWKRGVVGGDGGGAVIDEYVSSVLVAKKKEIHRMHGKKDKKRWLIHIHDGSSRQLCHFWIYQIKNNKNQCEWNLVGGLRSLTITKSWIHRKQVVRETRKWK